MRILPHATGAMGNGSWDLFGWLFEVISSHAENEILGGSHIQLANFGSNVVMNENVTGVRCVRNGIRKVPWMHRWWRRWSWQCMDRVTIAPRRCQPCHRCAMMHDKGWEGSNNDVIEIEAYHKIHEIYCNMPHRDVRSFLPKFAESVNLAFCCELWDVLNVLIND